MADRVVCNLCGNVPDVEFANAVPGGECYNCGESAKGGVYGPALLVTNPAWIEASRVGPQVPVPNTDIKARLRGLIKEELAGYSRSKPIDWDNEVSRRFGQYKFDEAQRRSFDCMCEFSYELARRILNECPSSLERIRAIEKLEEVLFWCTAAIVRPRE